MSTADTRRTAVRAPSGSLNFGELLERSATIATSLGNRDIGPGDLVAVKMPRDLDLLPTLLGVLRSGAAYLPIDIADPPRRTEAVVADAGAALVIVEDSVPDAAAVTPAELLAAPAAAPAPVVTADDLAYVIYTSGSTGAPKGVEVPHRCAAALFAAMDDHVAAQPGDVWLSLTSPAFDISVFEFFWTLGKGMTVELADTSGGALFSTALASDDHDITHVQATPTLLGGLLLDPATRRGLSRVRHVTSTGEALPSELGRELRALLPDAFINAYGPTETTIWSTVEHIGESVPDPMVIGRELAGQTVHLLDDMGQPVPPGSTGELVIAGCGVTNGYRGRPDLTTDRFFPDPSGPDGSVMYRTGDLGYHLDDGRLVCVGRADRQVKVRGHRIELDEVEAVLGELPGVEAAGVVARSAPTTTLAAFVVIADADAAPDAIRAQLAERLPAPAVPARIEIVAELPRSTSGKLDRRQLEDRLGDERSRDGAV